MERLVAFYDGIRCPATYDFVVFASMAKTVAKGRPLHFVFVPAPDGSMTRPGKFIPEEADYRFRHIVIEAAQLFDASFTVCATRDDARKYEGGDVFPFGYTVDAPVFTYMMDTLIPLHHQFGSIAHPRPSEKALRYIDQYIGDRKPIVVTLRTSRYPARNSDIDAWFEIYKERDIIFVPDTDAAFIRWPNVEVFPQASVNMDLRLALYWRAKLNCFTSNGCTALLYFTDRPYLLFKTGADGYMDKAEWDRLKIPYGTQPPFVKPNQKWVWEDDNLDVIRREVANHLCRA